MNTENKSLIIENYDDIKSKIYTVRGMQVMFDRDLASLYMVPTARLNEQVKRNIKRFPNHYMFQLTKEEMSNLISQFATSSWGGLRKLPFVFTEQGVSQLSSVLNSNKAIEISIKIIDTFVAMRRFLVSNAQIFQRLDRLEFKLLDHDNKIDKVFEALEQKDIQSKQGVFFDGEVFDAHQFISDLIRKATKSLVLIDNFVDDRTFLILSKRQKGVNATVFSKNISKELLLDLKKHNFQYPPIKLKELTIAHDRFLMIDEKEVYLFGSSLKDLGTRWVGFVKIEKDSLTLIDKMKNL
jgi:hypothetical protein